jgi:hypothetical protein
VNKIYHVIIFFFLSQQKRKKTTEYNQEHTLRVIRKQDRITGEARSKTINDFPYAAAIAQVLTLSNYY